MATFSLVDVKEIKSEVLRSSFSEAKIEEIADLILSNNGLLQPLILKRLDIDEYLVVNGDLEYYAAVRAREKDNRRGEMVNAFILSSNEEKGARQQIQAIREIRNSSGSIPEKTTKEDSRQEAENLVDWISSFESRLSQLREDFNLDSRKNNSRFKKLELELIQKDGKDLLAILNTLDVDQLAIRLSQYGINRPKPKELAQSICDAREQRKDKSFYEYQDVVDSIKGFGEKSMLKLIDGWNRVNNL
jgi:hypothetical protein